VRELHARAAAPTTVVVDVREPDEREVCARAVQPREGALLAWPAATTRPHDLAPACFQ
jgi:hypothetical protein